MIKNVEAGISTNSSIIFRDIRYLKDMFRNININLTFLFTNNSFRLSLFNISLRSRSSSSNSRSSLLSNFLLSIFYFRFNFRFFNLSFLYFRLSIFFLSRASSFLSSYLLTGAVPSSFNFTIVRNYNIIVYV